MVRAGKRALRSVAPQRVEPRGEELRQAARVLEAEAVLVRQVGVGDYGQRFSGGAERLDTLRRY